MAASRFAAVVPAGPIHDFRQVFDDPQIQHRALRRVRRCQEAQHLIDQRLGFGTRHQHAAVHAKIDTVEGFAP